MDHDSYRVKILHYLNPHLIWVEVAKDDDIVFEQIGLYGILPLTSHMDIFGTVTFYITDEWNPPAIAVISRFFTDFDEIIFKLKHVDRRTSIFNDNLHKYGDLVIKKNNKEVCLSELVVQSNFAVKDIQKFHTTLSSGDLKTKLTHFETSIVIEKITLCYNKSSKDNWKVSLQNQTSVFNTGLEFEELTKKNLERHNTYLSCVGKLEDKLNDFSMCKDIDDLALGRASKKTPAENSRMNSALLRRLLIINNDTKVSNSNVLKIKQDIVEKNAVKHKPALMTAVSNIDAKKKSKVEHGSTMAVNNSTNMILKENDNYKFNSEEVNACENKINNKFSPKNVKRNTDAVDFKSTTKEQIPSLKSSPIFRRVAYGPPGCNPSKLLVKMVPIAMTNEVKATSKNNEVDIPPNDILENEDSEVDLKVTEYNVKVNKSRKLFDKNKCSEINQNDIPKNELSSLLLHKYKDSKIHLVDESQKVSDLNKCNKISDMPKNKPSGLLLRKLQQLRTYSNTNKYDDSSTSKFSNVSKNTSAGAIDKYKAKNENGNFDDDDISEIIKDLNNVTANITNKIDYSKEIYVGRSEISVNPFRNIEGYRSVFVDKLVSPILMVHTKKNNKIQPSTNIRDVPFGTEIQVILANINIKNPTRIQSVSWSSILRGHSLFMTGIRASGKTMGYLPAVCRLVSDYHNNKDTVGPSCIIVCGTALSIAEVERLSKLFLGLKEKVVAFYAGVDELTITTSLLNGCDLLICMPSILVRLLYNTDFGIDLRSLRTFVIDDCERLFDVYAKEMKFITHNIKEMLKTRVNKEVKVQYVAASRNWCDALLPLAKTAPDSVVCIGAFQECILYSKTNMTVSYINNDNKITEVLAFMADIDRSKRTVIVCRYDDEIKYVEQVLKINKFIVFACDNTMTVHDLYNINVSWGNYTEPTMGPVLVCCDENLSHMNVTDAHNLFHYSLPSLYSTFCKRFSVLNDHYPSIFNITDQIGKVKVLLDEKNVEQLPKILKFVKRCTDIVPDMLDEVVKDILAEKDVSKARKFVPLCNYFLALGSCPDFWNCQERHGVLKDFDTPKEWVPKEGEIKFKILHYQSAVSYSARLLSVTINGETKKYPQTYSTICHKMGMYFSKENNQRLHGEPHLGDVCAVAVKQNFYVRCQVLKILNHYQNGKPNYVLIKLIDEEKLEKTRDIYLYHLPDDLKNIETHVACVRLASVKPIDRDITFPDLVKNHFKNLMDENDELFMRGRVVLSVGNCIFVESLEACQDLFSLNGVVVRYNFKRELLDLHAVDNNEHIAILKDHCLKSDLIVAQETFVEKSKEKVDAPIVTLVEKAKEKVDAPIMTLVEKANEIVDAPIVTLVEKSKEKVDAPVVPILEKVKEKVDAPILPKGDWASLDGEDLSFVYLSHAVDPDKFFLRLEKFENRMNSLLHDIQKYATENTCLVTDINKGDMVLAKFPDDETHERARIDNIIDENIVECFFVDQGDCHNILRKDLLPITETFIRQVPYQAIECRLVGVKPPLSEWTVYTNNWFSDYRFENEIGDMKMFCVKSYTKEISEHTESHKYGVAIIDTNTDKDIILNQMLVQLNLAKVNMNEIDFINDIISVCKKCDTNYSKAKNEKSDLTVYNKDANEGVECSNTVITKPRTTSIFDFDRCGKDDAPETNFEINVDNNFMGLFKASFPDWLTKNVKDNFSSIITSEGKIIKKDLQEPGASSDNGVNIIEISNSEAKTNKISTIATAINEMDIKETATNETDIKETATTETDIKGTATNETDIKGTATNETEKKRNATNEIDDEIKITALITRDNVIRKPKLLWRQTKKSVSMKIMLIGVEKYILLVKERSIKFLSTHDDTKYGFEIELYGVVDKNTAIHSNKGQYILIKMTKLLPINWLGLTRECDVNKWIVYDAESIDASSDEEEIADSTLAEVMKKIHENDELTESEDDEFRDDTKFY